MVHPFSTQSRKEIRESIFPGSAITGNRAIPTRFTNWQRSIGTKEERKSPFDIGFI